MSLGLLGGDSLPQKDYRCKAIEMFWASSSFVERFSYSTGRYHYTVILSPRYGLLLPDDFINPDASTLGAKTLKERSDWASKVISQMKDRLNMKQIEIAFFHTDHLHFELLAPLIEILGIKVVFVDERPSTSVER